MFWIFLLLFAHCYITEVYGVNCLDQQGGMLCEVCIAQKGFKSKLNEMWSIRQQIDGQVNDIIKSFICDWALLLGSLN